MKSLKTMKSIVVDVMSTVSWLAINLVWLAFWLVCRCAFHMGLNLWLGISRGELLDLSLCSFEWLKVLDSPQKLVLDFLSAFPQKGAVVLCQCPRCLIPVLVLAAGVRSHGAADNPHVILGDRFSGPPCCVWFYGRLYLPRTTVEKHDFVLRLLLSTPFTHVPASLSHGHPVWADAILWYRNGHNDTSACP